MSPDFFEALDRDIHREAYMLDQRRYAAQLRKIGFTAQEVAIYDARVAGINERLRNVTRRKGLS